MTKDVEHRIPFIKMHGIGNDYVYINAFATKVENPSSLAQRVSPRRTGIGSDGLILICPSQVAHCRMEMYNADGSRGEMCGNGIRCVGKYIYEHGITQANPLEVETDAGIKTLFLELQNNRVSRVTVDMDEPILEGSRIPVATIANKVVDHPLTVNGASYRVTCMSMGNPHCVVFVDDVEPLDLASIGPQFEHHPFFPQRVNTEFIRVLNPKELIMRVWERGSGETAACGTGACAAAAAAVLNHKSDRQVTIHLRGGDLEIEWREQNNRIYMTGAAEEVFAGALTA
jgi:diaminopimelate epimerase